jgi:iron(III) transport system ATP-binding protein
MAFIEIAGLGKSYGSVPAVRGIDLAIAEREFVTLLGPSGCGKTTTLRLLAGFVEPDAGSIKVGGRVLSARGRVVPPERRQMGMVFQNYAVWPHLSVFENVAFGLRATNAPRAGIAGRVERMLGAVGLAGLGGRNPSQLSGGQQQRVALARALVVEPAILLLDEPLSNLDAKLREHMRGELRRLQRSTGITFVYVTHDQAEAMALSDRIVVFRSGAIQQIGDPREVYERPANVFVADFMGLVNRLPGSVIGRTGDRVSVQVGPHTLSAVSGNLAADSKKVTVAVRPEAIRFGGSTAESANCLVGVITEATFLGNLVDYQVDAGGVMLRVQGERQHFQPAGSRVNLTIPIPECVAMTNLADDASP